MIAAVLLSLALALKVESLLALILKSAQMSKIKDGGLDQ